MPPCTMSQDERAALHRPRFIHVTKLVHPLEVRRYAARRGGAVANPYPATPASPAMVFLRDDSSAYDAPLRVVWDFFGSGMEHSDAHGHRDTRREKLADNVGIYSWTQDFRGKPERFTMRWTSYAPLGLGYEVLEGPFAGSKFFLYYTPQGERTGVAVVGEFTSPTIPSEEIAESVDRFFSREFEQDSAAIRARTRRR